MKKSHIAIWGFTLLFVCLACISAFLYFVSGLLSQHFHLGLNQSTTLPFELAKQASGKIKSLAQLAIGISVILPTAILGFFTWAFFSSPKRELHGSARFASRSELVKSGLLQVDKPGDEFPSILVGKMGNDFLYFRGQQFMFLAAPTRSGKGVGIVIPNCLHYRDSLVVLDIKGENYDISAGFRAKCGQEVYRFAPDDEDGNSACWNALAYVRDDLKFRLKDLMNITNLLYPPSEDVWSSTAENLFLGIALYMMDTAKERDNFNIATVKRYAVVLEFLKDEDTFKKYVEKRKDFEPLSPECIEYLTSYCQTSDKMRSSIKITFDQPLAIFSDPITANATSKNSFDMRDVRKKRMSIYVVVKPASIDKFGKMLNLFFQQLLTLNMEKQPKEDASLKYQCLLLLDEFTAMGRIAVIEKASAYMAGYNMRLLLIFQSKSQVQDRKLYDEKGAQTMLTNMALQVMYAPRDENDAKEYSDMIGYMTEKGVSKSRQLTGKSGRSENVSDQRRAVLLPQEVKAIGIDKEIISMENMLPALVSKIVWYKEPAFIARANLPPPVVEIISENSNYIEYAPPSPVLHFAGATTSQPMPLGATFEVGFSPKRNALEIVMSLIMEAKSELLVAAYSFTSRDIAHALVEAQKKGVDVRLVVDHEQNNSEQGGYNAIDYLESEGLPIFRSKNYAAMHHKFMVADGVHLQLGSFNYTTSANTRNAETALVMRNAALIAEIYRTEWFRLTTEPKTGVDTIIQVDKGLEVLKSFGIF